MKKYFSVVLLMFAIIIINNCCEKESNPNPNMPTEIKTLNDLNGTWDFVKLYFPGKGEYTDCLNPIPPSELLSLSINSAAGTCTITNKCLGIIAKDWSITFNPGPKQISIKRPIQDGVGSYIFYILNYDSPNLVLRRDVMSNGTVETELTLKKR
jgi:hypothetical protein